MLSGQDVLAMTVATIIFSLSLYDNYDNINRIISPCEITAINNRICHEKYGDLFLNENITINNDGHTLLYCGKIRTCETSPCNVNYNVGDKVYCYRDDSGYHLDVWLPIRLPFLIFIMVISGLFLCAKFLREIYSDKSQREHLLHIANQISAKLK